MTPALTSWLLAIPYLVAGAGLAFFAWAAGGSAYALLKPRNPTDQRPWYFTAPGAGILLLSIRVASGFALLSWLGAVFGVAGQFKLPVMLTVYLLVIVVGLSLALRFSPPHRQSLLKDRLYAGGLWVAAPITEKILMSAVALGTCAIVVNAFIGALVPDMNQDPMWYHLSVAQQWTFSGRFDAYPSIMQSAFPLAAESLFAGIFLIGGDPVFCSLLSVICGVGFFAALVSGAWASLANLPDKGYYKGWGVSAVLAVCVPLFTMYGLVAPIQPKNDIITLYWTCAGAMAICIPLLAAQSAPRLGWWITGGFLLGTACSAKPPVLCVAFFVMVFSTPLAFYYERRAGKKGYRAIAGVAICLLMIAMAAAPWMFRGYRSHGVPLYPVGVKFFKVNPEFAPSVNALTRLQAVPGLSAAHWLQKLREFPDRLFFGAEHGEKFVFIYILAALSGCLLARGRWQWLSFILFAQLIFLVGVKGGVEVYRLFSPAYCLAAPIIAWLVARDAPRIRSMGRVISGFCVWMALFGSLVIHQARAASFVTYAWEFRPVLSSEDVKAYARHAEKGSEYLDFIRIRPQIHQQERVLLLGNNYPFYLHRNTLWNDEALDKGGLADRWRHMSRKQAEDFLRQEKIDVILTQHNPDSDYHPEPPVADLLQADIIQRFSLSDESTSHGWALYRMEK